MRKFFRAADKEKQLRVSDVAAAVKTYVTRLRELHALSEDKRNCTIINEYNYRKDMLAKEAEVLKTAARAMAVVGVTTVVSRDEDIEVSVVSKTGSLRYDAEEAWKSWPPAVLRQVMVVDPKEVKRLLDNGEFTDKLAKKAALPPDPVTPAVYIKPVK